MRTPRSRLALAGLFVLLLFGQPAWASLRLKAGPFDPLLGQPALPDGLKLDAEPAAGYFVVQFDRAIDEQLLALLRGRAAEPLKYLPDRSYLVRLPEGAASAVRAMPGVRWLGAVQPGWKLSPDLGTRTFQDPSRRLGGMYYATADLFPDEDPAPVMTAVEALGAKVIQLQSFAATNRIKLHATMEQLHAVARIPAVYWIEEVGEVTTRNNNSRWVVQSDVSGVTSIWDHGLHGENQIIGHIDNRIDMNSCYFLDPADNTPGPSHRKVVAYRSNAGQGAESHGTHTAGTSAGDQFPINGTINNNGIAYEAKLSHSRLADVTGSGIAPSNLYDFLSDAHTDGGRVHTNSWGDDGTTQYTTWCVDIDQFSYDFEDSLVLFAETNGSSLKTPENAKNVLAVGASQNGTSNDNFCSGGRGPTSDGRRKPEIFAPGCSIVSARNATTCSTRSSTGTSMACPAVTAAGALVRQYFEEGWYPSGTQQAADTLVPSGALVKAMLLNSTVDMTGITGYPSNEEGWGRVLLENSMFFNGDVRSTSVMADIRNADGLQTGQVEEYTLTVNASAEPLKITLVFTDPPAALLASPAEINDLDLEVQTPGGVTYLGNVIDTTTGFSDTGGTADPQNNVEMVIVESPQAGEWTVRVEGTAVNEGRQGFALVASGQVEPFTPGKVRYDSHVIDDSGALGNNDGIVDPGESVTLPLTLKNQDTITAGSVSARLSSDLPAKIRVTDSIASFPDIGADSTAESLPPHYRYTVAPDVSCGTVIRFKASTSSTQGAGETSFSIDIGNTRVIEPSTAVPLQIPKKSSSGVSTTIQVNPAFTIQDAQSFVDIAHGDISELVVRLTSPTGTAVTLHNETGAGTADIVATYDRDRQPDGPGTMDDFNGEAAQGTWTLTMIDNHGGPVKSGTLRGWTLELVATSPLSCSPLDCGGDPVPGAIPGSLTLARENGTDLRLDWPAVSGATAYRIWRSTDEEFELEELLATTTQTTYLVPGAINDPTTRFYTVRAINSCDWEGP